MMLFDWIYPAYTCILQRAVEIWYQDPQVNILFYLGIERAQMVKAIVWYERSIGSEFDPPWIKKIFQYTSYCLYIMRMYIVYINSPDNLKSMSAKDILICQIIRGIKGMFHIPLKWKVMTPVFDLSMFLE